MICVVIYVLPKACSERQKRWTCVAWQEKVEIRDLAWKSRSFDGSWERRRRELQMFKYRKKGGMRVGGQQ